MWNNILISIALITAVIGIFLQLSSLAEDEEITPQTQGQEIQVAENREDQKNTEKEETPPLTPKEAQKIKPSEEEKKEPVATTNTQPPRGPLLQPMPDGWMPPGVTRSKHK